MKHTLLSLVDLAMNRFDNPVKVTVDGWLKSQGHRENIERALFDTSGVGVVVDSGGMYFFTQIFVGAR